MRTKGFLVFALTVLVAGSSFAGEKCTADAQACLNYMAENAQSKGWVGLHLDHADGGYAITKVVEDSPAAKAGFKTGDVIIALNGMMLAEESEELQAFHKNKMKVGNTVTYTVTRGGDEKKLEVKLAKMPEEVMYQMVGAHMMDHAEMAQAKNHE